MKDWVSKNIRNLLPIVFSLLILVAILYFFGIRPNQQLNDAKGALQPKEFIELKNGIRAGLGQALGGAILLIGLFFTWRNIRATEKNLVISQENIRATQDIAARNVTIALEGQITGRFTNAIELLSNHTSVSARLGAIYALERIARDSEKDHWTIMEILTAYIRDNVSWDGDEIDVPETVEEVLTAIERPLTDIQACLDVLARRARHWETKDQVLDLIRVNLRRYQVIDGHFENAYLTHSRLDWSSLNGAHLEGALLFNSHFEKAFLVGANLEGADLEEVHFEGARLIDANFKNSKLTGTHFDNAQLLDAHFEGVDMSTATGLTQEQINLAIVDEQTRLPNGIIMRK